MRVPEQTIESALQAKQVELRHDKFVVFCSLFCRK